MTTNRGKGNIISRQSVLSLFFHVGFICFSLSMLYMYVVVGFFPTCVFFCHAGVSSR